MQQSAIHKRLAFRRRSTRRPPRQASRPESIPRALVGRMDLPFLLLTILLTVLGLVMLFSASFPSASYKQGDPAYFLKRQAIFALLGMAAMVVMSRMDYHRLRGMAKILMYVSIFLLVLVLVPGVALTNAMREIMAGDIISGLSRTADAILVASAIALGTVVGLAIGQML